MSLLLSQKDKKIGIFGLGKTGLSSYRALSKVAEVICYDQDTSSKEAFVKKYGTAPLVDIFDARWQSLNKIVLSPGVPLNHDIVQLARTYNIPITSDIELLFEECKSANFIAITGTNGKSTSVSLTGHILQSCGLEYSVGGNIGIPVLDMNLTARGYVLELSSFQLDLLTNFKAKIAVLLNITPDHLDRHGNLTNYIASKNKIFDRMDKDSFAIINMDNTITKKLFDQLTVENKTNLIPISTSQILDSGVSICHNVIYDKMGISCAFNLPTNKYLQGPHNQENIAASYAVCCLVGLSPEKIVAAIEEFKGLPHRMQYLGSMPLNDLRAENMNNKEEIHFYNDSKATNAEAAYKSISLLDNIYWLAGGIAKEGGITALEPLFPKIRKAYLFGKDKEILLKTLQGKVNFQICCNLTEGFNAALRDAKLDINADIIGERNILLAPSCASFDQFKNFEERGELFIKLYNMLTGS